MPTQEEINIQLLETIKKLQESITKPREDEWAIAQEPFREEELDITKRQDYEALVTKPSKECKLKEIKGYPTGTFLDYLFLDANNKSIGGLPFGSQLGLVGLSGGGKSILVEEIAVSVSSSGRKVLLVTTEDIFDSNSDRFDLQARLIQKSKILNLDWENIKDNLLVLDAIKNPELREWSIFGDVYRYVCERNNVSLVLIDSASMLEAYRGALKYRIAELTRFNQLRGITGVYVNQRSEEDWDKFALAGGMGVAHTLDGMIFLDYGRLYYQDMQVDTGDKKRGDRVNILRVNECRLCNFVHNYIEVEITEQGFLRPTENGEKILASYK